MMLGDFENVSQAGRIMAKRTGVRAIMKDIIDTLATSNRSFINLSPGNPAIIPEVALAWRDCTRELLEKQDFDTIVGKYGASQGYEPFIEAVVEDLNQRYNLNLTDRNCVITPGSQSVFFFAANAFSGPFTNGEHKKLLLPLCPDYTGYGGVHLHPECVYSIRPELAVFEGSHRIKYMLSTERVLNKETGIGPSVGAVVFSRPNNPCGNILTDSEVDVIVTACRGYNIPVFIDSAYAPPYPALNNVPMSINCGNGVVHCMSLSKVGLPGERVGVAIGDPETIEVMEAFQTNACIHSSRFGQAIAAQAIKSGLLAELASNVVRPFYAKKMALINELLDSCFQNFFPWYLHQSDGGLFAWVWCKDLPMSDTELYEKGKHHGVLIVPGSAFFPGLNDPWQHASECFRISLTASDEDLVEGVKRLSILIKDIYSQIS